MKSEILNNIFEIDKNRILEPFIEDHLRAFNNGEWLEAELVPLSDEWICKNRVIADIEQEAENDLLKMAANIRNNTTLKFLFFHCCKLLYSENKLYPNAVTDWSDFTALLNEGKGSMFLLLLSFHAIDHIVAIHKTMNIPQEITLATCADVGSRVQISKEFKNGEIGISTVCLNWHRTNFVAGRIFQIGRLQFHLVQFNQPFRVYRKRTASEYMIICEPGLRVSPSGALDGAGGKLNENSWTTKFTLLNDQIKANQVDDKKGNVIRNPVIFSEEEWMPVINSDSLVMNIHIPRGPRISNETFFDSIAQAFDFFEKKREPTVTLDAAICTSWMFDPVLQEFLSDSSALVSLQNSAHLFPFPTLETNCGIYFIFGKERIDINSVPTDTSLRKGVVEHLRKGGVLTGGGMIFFKDEYKLKRNINDN